MKINFHLNLILTKITQKLSIFFNVRLRHFVIPDDDADRDRNFVKMQMLAQVIENS